MKKVLILAIGCQLDPWNKMIQTSLNTWDSISVEGVETIFYCGHPLKQNTDKIIYFDVKENYHTMGEKMLQAFDWALKNKDFDYIARVNGSCFVDKKQLVKFIQALPEFNCFSALEVTDKDASMNWAWGGGQFIISKDVIEKIVNNKPYWNHGVMEDVALGRFIHKMNIPYLPGKACSINKTGKGWILIGYGGDSIEFTNFEDVKNLENHFYRVKIDNDRDVDAFLMNELFSVLK